MDTAAAEVLGSEASRMAAFLGLPRAENIGDLDLVKMIAKGLPTKTTETVVRRVDPMSNFCARPTSSRNRPTDAV